MSPTPPLASVLPGTERSDDLGAHEARRALRLLVARAFGAIDAGDGVGLESCFASGGRWNDPSGHATADGAIDGHLRRWRVAVPWSVHWFANETTTVEGGRAVAHWLWFAASLDGTGEAVWSAGDLDVEATTGAEGWRLASFAMADRYRTSWREGWLVEPLRTVDLGTEVGSPSPPPEHARPRTTVTLPPGPTGSDLAARLRALAAETEVRNVVADLVAAVEAGDVSRAVDQLTTDCHLELDDARVVGGPDLRTALAEQAELGAGLLRVLASWWCRPGESGQVVAGWRELTTAVVVGAATWLAAEVEAEAVEDGGRWRLSSMVRRELLRSTYAPPWTPGPVAEVGR